MVAKHYDYVVTLKPAKSYEAFDWISQLLIVIAVLADTYIAIISSEQRIRVEGAVFAIAILGLGIFSRFTGKPYRFALLVAVAGWILLFYKFVIAILYAICSILEKQVKFRQEIGFDDTGVTFNSFPKKTYKWHEVSNVVLKDGIITVDLYNNRIIQKELADDTTPAIEKEFNDFCRPHLLSV